MTNTTIYLITSALLSAVVLGGLYFFFFNDKAFFSVEFGLAELSPRGESGGYAMPASGASAPAGFRHSCTLAGTRVTLSWGASTASFLMDSDDSNHALDIRDMIVSSLGVKTVLAGGGGDDNDNGGGGVPRHNHPVPAPVTYDVRVGTIYSRDGLTTRSVSIPVTPGQNYSMQVRGCAGGECSSWQSYSFSCPPPPPTVDLTADATTVPYNTSTTVRWNSNNANSCTASRGSAGWPGAKSVNGSQSTGPLTSATTFLIQCRNSSGANSVPDQVTVGITYGTGADIDVSGCGSSSGGDRTVRKGDRCTINWDSGTSDPINCQIRAGASVLRTPLSPAVGSFTWVVPGEAELILDCENGQNVDRINVQVLPEFQET